MNLPKQTIETIEAMRSHGDIARIAEKSGYHYVTIARALNAKKGSPDVIEAIITFYAERTELLNQFQN